MPVTSTNHGLNVITHDTGSANRYRKHGKRAHKGIGWFCSVGTAVYAMRIHGLYKVREVRRWVQSVQ